MIQNNKGGNWCCCIYSAQCIPNGLWENNKTPKESRAENQLGVKTKTGNKNKNKNKSPEKNRYQNKTGDSQKTTKQQDMKTSTINMINKMIKETQEPTSTNTETRQRGAKTEKTLTGNIRTLERQLIYHQKTKPWHHDRCAL